MESYSSVFEELHEQRFLKDELIQQILYGTHYSWIYIDTVIQNVIGRLSLTIFVKISKGKIDGIIYAQALKKDGKVSEDICLLIDEMYLKNVRSILEVNRLPPTRMENYVKELSIPWFSDSRIERVHPM